MALIPEVLPWDKKLSELALKEVSKFAVLAPSTLLFSEGLLKCYSIDLSGGLFEAYFLDFLKKYHLEVGSFRIWYWDFSNIMQTAKKQKVSGGFLPGALWCWDICLFLFLVFKTISFFSFQDTTTEKGVQFELSIEFKFCLYVLHNLFPVCEFLVRRIFAVVLRLI